MALFVFFFNCQQNNTNFTCHACRREKMHFLYQSWLAGWLVVQEWGGIEEE